jgi:SAM-dependent methyltransferase
MTPAEIARSYDSIADRWLEPNLATNGIRQHEHALKFRSGGGLALDVGCGCSPRFRHLLEQHGYAVEGLDLSPRMIELAKQDSPRAVFHQVDICKWTVPRRYDFITAWDSVWHVPLDQSELVLRKLCGALTTNGILIWTSGGLDHPEEKWDSAMGPPVYYSVLGIPATLRTIEQSGCVCRHLEYDQLPEKHVYWIAQKAD